MMWPLEFLFVLVFALGWFPWCCCEEVFDPCGDCWTGLGNEDYSVVIDNIASSSCAAATCTSWEGTWLLQAATATCPDVLDDYPSATLEPECCWFRGATKFGWNGITCATGTLQVHLGLFVASPYVVVAVRHSLQASRIYWFAYTTAPVACELDSLSIPFDSQPSTPTSCDMSGASVTVSQI